MVSFFYCRFYDRNPVEAGIDDTLTISVSVGSTLVALIPGRRGQANGQDESNSMANEKQQSPQLKRMWIRQQISTGLHESTNQANTVEKLASTTFFAALFNGQKCRTTEKSWAAQQSKMLFHRWISLAQACLFWGEMRMVGRKSLTVLPQKKQ